MRTRFDIAMALVAALVAACGGASTSPPGAPTGLSSEALVRAASLTWTAPASSGGSPITGYTVSISPATPAAIFAVVGTTASVFGLANGTSYTFAVTATNAGGTGAASVPSPTVTTPSLPGAPTGLAATASDAAVVLVWTEPSSTGGRALTGYIVVPSPAAPSAVFAVVGARASITGLANGTAYTFTVHATTTVGNGPASDPSGAVTPVAPPSGLAYLSNPAVYTRGSAITNTPNIGGGPVASYAISPALPAGLALNPSSGVISGTPTVIQAAASFTVTATNLGGSTPVALLLTVNDIAPSGLAYSPNPAIFTLGTPGASTAPTTSGGGPVVWYTVNKALPSGLAIDQATGVISGTATLLSNADGYVVTGTNSGGSATATVQITVVDKPPCDFVYAYPVESYEVGREIRENTPTFAPADDCTKDATGIAFRVDAFLGGEPFPSGLDLDPQTGAITGTPTSVQPTDSGFTVTATSSGGRRQKGIKIGVYPPPAPSYQVYTALEARTQHFYLADQNWPVDQSKFGFCETASSSGLISYARYGTTNRVSPQYTLYRAFDSPGWFPLPPPPPAGGETHSPNFYLWYSPDLANLWDFYAFRGYVLLPGWPGSATDPYKAAFENMYCDLEGSPPGCTLPSPAPEPVPAQLPYKSDTWNTGYEAYAAAVAADPGLVVPYDLRQDMVSLSKFEGSTVSARIASALNTGHIVQIMWKILEYKIPTDTPDEIYYYQYDTVTGTTLAKSTPVPTGMNNNAYALGRPALQGGDHWVYLFSYATATDGPGQKIFFMRNSWGSKNGENGNYYMADNFLDGQYGVLDKTGHQTYDVNGNPVLAAIVQDAWALKIQPPPP